MKNIKSKLWIFFWATNIIAAPFLFVALLAIYEITKFADTSRTVQEAYDNRDLATLTQIHAEHGTLDATLSILYIKAEQIKKNVDIGACEKLSYETKACQQVKGYERELESEFIKGFERSSDTAKYFFVVQAVKYTESGEYFDFLPEAEFTKIQKTHEDNKSNIFSTAYWVDLSYKHQNTK